MGSKQEGKANQGGTCLAKARSPCGEKQQAAVFELCGAVSPRKRPHLAGNKYVARFGALDDTL